MARTSISKPYERTPARKDPRSVDGQWLHDKAPGAGRLPSAVLNTGRPPPTGPVVDTKLVVSNLHYNITTKDLVDIFGQVGTLVDEPKIKYDRSGRSTGIAFVHYETAAEAAKALKVYDGKLAKGERMSIAYDTLRVRAAGAGGRRVVSAPSSLADRIQKPALLDRMGVESSRTKAGEDMSKTRAEAGPVRNRRPRRAGTAGAAPRGERFRKEAKTQEDLDKELDAFMAADTAPAPAAAAAQANDGDIEMA